MGGSGGGGGGRRRFSAPFVERMRRRRIAPLGAINVFRGESAGDGAGSLSNISLLLAVRRNLATINSPPTVRVASKYGP